jgi:hypothetical protein
MKRSAPRLFALLASPAAFVSSALFAFPGALPAAASDDIPHFARKYGLECRQCHVSPPKLNEFGEAFVRNNYRMPGLRERARRTVPMAIWVSYRADLPPGAGEMDRSVRNYLNRVEVMSGGQVVVPWLSYFVEWRPLSRQLRGDGTILDRSGRFEDLFLTAQGDRVQVSVGQFRQVEQVDISRRLGVNEPGFFSRSLPGAGEGTAREIALRSFSLSGRSPGVRAGWVKDVSRGWEWTTFATVPVPGELSIPLTSEARREASNELELDPKGVVLESFVRRGLTSYGLHAFLDSRDRYQAGAVATGSDGPWMWTAALGAAKLNESLRGRWSAEGEHVLSHFAVVGGRGEGQAGTDPAFVAFGNFHFPGTSYTFRLTVEQRFQRGRGTTLMELGAIF